MLSLTSPADAATATRALTRTGAWLLRDCAAGPSARSLEAAIGRPAAAALVFARPRPQASTGSVLFGNATHAAGQADSARQQRPSQKYARTTRVATAGGGAMGPHPARDPV